MVRPVLTFGPRRVAQCRRAVLIPEEGDRYRFAHGYRYRWAGIGCTRAL